MTTVVAIDLLVGAGEAWWEKPATVANALATIVTAGAAVWAVYLAVAESRSSRHQRIADRRAALYDRVVLDPVLVLLAGYSKDCMSLLDANFDALRALRAGGDKGKLNLACQEAAAEFNRGLYAAKVEIRGAMLAWEDEVLAASVFTRLADFQDELIELIAAMAGDQIPLQAAFHSALQEGLGRVRRLLVEHVPAPPRLPT